MGCVTLLTDFGTRDAYVGAMKGAILRIAPEVQLVDISHAVPPQDVSRAGRLLAAVVPYYPAGTVHLVVVDPGVGGSRQIVALEVAESYVVAPDNGCLSLLMAHQNVARVVRVENRRFFNDTVSTTFHGRDILGPVAAHIARGAALDRLGPALDPKDLVALDLPPVFLDVGRARGEVTAVDRFGNLITNLHRDALAAQIPPACWPRAQTLVGPRTLTGIMTHYGAVQAGKTLALWGSDGYLEIAVNGGHAARQLDLTVGDVVCLDSGRPEHPRAE